MQEKPQEHHISQHQLAGATLHEVPLLWHHLLQHLAARRQQNPPPCSKKSDTRRKLLQEQGGHQGQTGSKTGLCTTALCHRGTSQLLRTQSSPRQQQGRGGGHSMNTLSAPPRAWWGQSQTIPALRGRSPQPICGSTSLWQTKPTLADGEPCQGRGDKPAFVSAKAKLALGKRLDSSTTGVCALAAFHMEVSNPRADDSRSLQRSLSLAPALLMRGAGGPTSVPPSCKDLQHTAPVPEHTLIATGRLSQGGFDPS